MKALIIFILLTFNAMAFDEFSNCSMNSAANERLTSIYNTVYSVSKELNVDHCLVLAIIITESSLNKDAVSKKGAKGLMQVMPKTHKEVIKKMSTKFYSMFTRNLNNDLSHEEIENIIVGVSYVKFLNSKFSKKDHVVIAYNMGPRWLNNKLNKNETVGNKNNYLNKVNKNLVMIASM